LHIANVTLSSPAFANTFGSSNTLGEFHIITVMPPSPFIKNIIKMKGNEISVKE